jgi:hypothetical protein
MRGSLVLAAFVALGGTALAEPIEDAQTTKTRADEEQLVLINASPKLGATGQVDRARRVLDSRGMLMQLPDSLTATFEGRNVLIADLESIRDAYGKSDFKASLDLVQANETRILAAAAGGDPVPALSELASWRGLIAAGMDEPDEAVHWFRAAQRLNPAWTPDKKLTGPRARALVKKARKETDETGKLKLDIDPEDAMVQIDGGKAQPANGRITLKAGIHLMVITAPGRTTHAELVDIKPEKPEMVELSLEKESKSDRAAKLVDAAVSAPPGKARLKEIKKLSKMAGGATRFLVIEEGSEDKVTVRVYDVDTKKVSKPIEFDAQASSAAIARKVTAALDPDNMIEPSTVMIIEKQRRQRWYERWYVWAGIAAVAGGSVLTYQFMTRDPSAVRGF